MLQVKSGWTVCHRCEKKFIASTASMFTKDKICKRCHIKRLETGEAVPYGSNAVEGG